MSRSPAPSAKSLLDLLTMPAPSYKVNLPILSELERFYSKEDSRSQSRSKSRSRSQKGRK